MTVVGTKPHPIYLAGRWVESPDVLEIANPADGSAPAGATFNATEAQYEEAVEAAVAAFETTRHLPAYERGRILRDISAGIRERREELGRLIALEAGKPIRDAHSSRLSAAAGAGCPGKFGNGGGAWCGDGSTFGQ